MHLAKEKKMLHTIIYLLILLVVTSNSSTVPKNGTESWSGNWFPKNPNAVGENSDLNELFTTNITEKNAKEPWIGEWFPNIPTEGTQSSIHEEHNMVHPDCDDGKTNIDTDFSPEDKRQSYNYICIGHKSNYEPNFATSPIQREYIVPPAYRAPSICLNETIEYEERLPTFGAHRHLLPKYGEYKFLPAQRWIHNLEYGAIVMLYHPCGNQMQIEKLRSTLNACLYRHIITPSILLLAERPLALVAWGKSLEMSVVDVSTVVEFIKENAKKGPQTIMPYYLQEYEASLDVEAKLVTDDSDSQICENINL